MILLSCDVEGEGEYHGPAVRLCKTSILPRNLARRSFVRKGAVILLALIGCALQPVARAARAHSKLPPPAPPPMGDFTVANGLQQPCGTRYPSYVRSSARLGDSVNLGANALDNYSGDDGASPLLYIVGGDEVDDDQFWPWSVALYELDPLNGQRAFICSGSLISDKFVLTAAHCIQQSRFDILAADEVFLRIASIRLDDLHANFYQVERIYLHPEYTVDRKTNDIALLKLRAGQRLPARARPICLPSQVANRIDFTDQQVTIIGWGKTNPMQGNEPTRLIDVVSKSRNNIAQRAYSSASTSDANNNGQQETGQTNDTLLQAQVRVTNTDQCNRNYSRLEIDWLNIDEHFICASDPQGKRDACQGDSGGPMMWNDQQATMMMGQPQQFQSAPERWYQLGLVSFGYGCANNQYPGVYTRISFYMPWISRIVNEHRVPLLANHQNH